MFKKKTIVTTNRGTEELTSAVETWIVEWTKRYGEFRSDTRQSFQAFTSQEEAAKFQQSLEQAFKLVGNTIDNCVKLYKQENGL